MTVRPVLTQAEIESAIMDTADRLEELVEDYADIAETFYVSEAEFKRQHALTTLAVIQHPPTDDDGKVRKMIAAERDALIELRCNDARKEAAIAAASREVAREAMATHRTRIDSLRTLAANVRPTCWLVPDYFDSVWPTPFSAPLYLLIMLL